MQKFSLGTNFRGQASPWKLNPQKFVHEELATVITANYSYPRKFNPRNIVTMKICVFTVYMPGYDTLASGQMLVMVKYADNNYHEYISSWQARKTSSFSLLTSWFYTSFHNLHEEDYQSLEQHYNFRLVRINGDCTKEKKGKFLAMNNDSHFFDNSSLI